VHDLRHTCATLLLVQGVHPRVVMEVLGHSRIGVTMDVYTHVVSQVQREAALLMHRALTGPAAVKMAVTGPAEAPEGVMPEEQIMPPTSTSGQVGADGFEPPTSSL
jgi:Site-specific recombinase XerD